MVVKQSPFKNIGGITPCPAGWLVLPARLAGVTVAAEEAFVVKRLFEVLDFRPAFEGAAINAPMGLFDLPSGQFRPCDHEAKTYVGWPRSVGVEGIPCRSAIQASSKEEAKQFEPWMTKHDLRRLRWLKEAEREIQPFHARSFFSANPDVSFTAMNSDEPLKTSPYHEDGRKERLELIRQRLPGVDEVITRTPPPGAGLIHLLQAAALLYTARRAAGRAITRMPLDPSWDDTGIRMEIVR
jgi:predicted RNase H-like nuclease